MSQNNGLGAQVGPAFGVVPLFLLVALMGGPALWAQPAPERDAGALLNRATEGDANHVANQLANVKRLLETSSGAKRVSNSDNALAKKIQVDAVGRFRKAEAAYGAKEYGAAEGHLQAAAKSMFQAIRILGPAREVVLKKRLDFKERQESTFVLLEALQRIAKEEGTQGTAAKTVEAVKKTVSAALQIQKEGNHDSAREMLDVGYTLAKAAVDGLRDGKTLVRTLKFENEEAEYHYELDRNDTHHMLVRILLQKKRNGAQTAGTVDQFVQRAEGLRRQAEQKSESGNFREAIRLLESSTRELVRAIRGAGVYIPG